MPTLTDIVYVSNKAPLIDAPWLNMVNRFVNDSQAVAGGGSSLITHINSGTGAVARTVQDKLREFVSSADFNNLRGTDNWAFGSGALASTLTAVQCVAMGTGALGSCDAGFASVAIGHRALASMQGDAYCTAVGAFALENANLIGNVNLISTALGAYALNENADGQYNVGVGGYAGQHTTSGYFCTFIGMRSGTENTIGFSNTYVGHGAGQLLTGASNFNTIVGEAASPIATLAVGLSLLGYEAGANNLTGNYLTAIGFAAAASSLGGLGTAVGKQAAYSVGMNIGWVGVGYEAGINATGGNWTAVGHQAMGGANNGGGVTALGYRAAYANGANYDNCVALGSNSTNTRGNQCAIGDTSLAEIRTKAYLVQSLVSTSSTLMDNNGEFAFFVVDNTHVNFKFKGSDGTVRTATGAFSGGWTLA